jgi:hypothetical protein
MVLHVIMAMENLVPPTVNASLIFPNVGVLIPNVGTS